MIAIRVIFMQGKIASQNTAWFEKILNIKVSQERIEKVKGLVRFDIPDLSEEIKELYRRGLSTVRRHVADHQARGESLLDKEKEFTLRCHC